MTSERRTGLVSREQYVFFPRLWVVSWGDNHRGVGAWGGNQHCRGERRTGDHRGHFLRELHGHILLHQLAPKLMQELRQLRESTENHFIFKGLQNIYNFSHAVSGVKV